MSWSETDVGKLLAGYAILTSDMSKNRPLAESLFIRNFAAFLAVDPEAL
jgi:hypothetical protein